MPNIQEKSLIKRIEEVFHISWDKPALTNVGSDFTYTYGDVAERVAYMHVLFKELGLKPGDKIAVCDKNSAEWTVVLLAIITYRGVAVPLLPDFSESQIAALCEHSESKVLFGGARLAKLWAEGEAKMPFFEIDRVISMDAGRLAGDVESKALEQFKLAYPNGLNSKDVSFVAEKPEDLMLISYTSGSTGNPKGVMLPYRSLWSNNTFAIEKLPIPDEANYLFVLPMAHMFGFSFDFLFAFAKSAHAYILTKTPAPKVLVDAFKVAKPHVFLCVPLIMEKIINGKVRPVLEKPLMKVLINVPGVRQLICKKVRTQLMEALGGNVYEVIMGGAALNRDVEKIIRMVKFPYVVGYGMTECGPLLSYSDWHCTRMGSCGQAVDRVEMAVQSKDPVNIPGEVVVKGMNNMTGYFKNPDATAEAIDEEGWLHTGDLGVIDREGYLYIRGRKKNMLLSSNGQNIYPEEVEDHVVGHSIFDECVVVQREDKLVALVYAADTTLAAAGKTRGELDLAAIKKDLNRTLPKFCQLAGMEQREEEFEKTPKKSIRRFLYT